MNERNLSFREFLQDLRLVVVSPRRRFALVREREAVWGSLLLLIIPRYIAFGFAGGIYFDRDPFPGYSFALPAILAALAALLSVALIHVFGRLLEARGRYAKATGRFRGILAVFGYTQVPTLLAMALVFIPFTFAPGQIVTLLRDFRIYFISGIIAIGVTLFIWNLILVVLALRFVYPMRDYKIVLALILGSAAAVVPALALSWIVVSAHVNSACVQPLLTDRLLRIVRYEAEAHPSSSRGTSINIHVDRLRYTLRSPERFDLVTFEPAAATGAGGEKVRIGTTGSSIFSLSGQAMGRIVGLPGETVELAHGALLIDGRICEEPYVQREYRSEASFAPTRLSGSQYFVLPEDRKLVESLRHTLIVRTDQISGRAILNRWPFGWLLHRPTAYEKPAKLSEALPVIH